MNDKTKDEVDKLITALDNSAIDDEMQQIQKIDPIERIKQSLLTFFVNRLEKISENDDFKHLIEQKIREKIESDSLSVSQLFQIYSQVSDDSIVATNSLLALFKPSKEGNSPLLENNKEASDEDLNTAFKNMNSTQLEKVDRFFRLMERFASEQETLDKSEEKE